jgi:hypothetical protein
LRDWAGIRKASNNHCLSETDKDLTGPHVEGLELLPVRLDNTPKELIKKFSTI